MKVDSLKVSRSQKVKIKSEERHFICDCEGCGAEITCPLESPNDVCVGRSKPWQTLT